MSDDDRPGVTREDLPDEMPRSTTSDDAFRRARTHRLPMLVWLFFGLLIAVAFVTLLWVLGPPTKGVGQSSADVVIPAAPPVRKP